MKTARSTQELGKKGEEIAAHFLISLDYTILQKNFRFGHKEVDLIAKKANQTVFFEVKTRSSNRWGYGEEAVTEQKRKNLLHAALDFMRKEKMPGADWRFDILVIELDNNHELKNIEHIQDVFH